MQTVKVEALKLHPEFYCTKKGRCDKLYTCLNPGKILDPVCPNLLIKAPGRKLHEEIQSHRR